MSQSRHVLVGPGYKVLEPPSPAAVPEAEVEARGVGVYWKGNIFPLPPKLETLPLLLLLDPLLPLIPILALLIPVGAMGWY